jgi:hypothetical protein
MSARMRGVRDRADRCRGRLRSERDCTIDRPGGSCTYVAADAEDRDRCTRIAFPREVVSYPASFTDARNYATNCQ